MTGTDSSKQASAVEKTPDALGLAGRVQVAMSTLAGIQQQKANLRAEVAMNELGDDEKSPSDPSRTVKVRREFLAAAELRVVEEFADEMPEVRRLIAEREAAEAAARDKAAKAG